MQITVQQLLQKTKRFADSNVKKPDRVASVNVVAKSERDGPMIITATKPIRRA
jgi:hypothetical protein